MSILSCCPPLDSVQDSLSPGFGLTAILRLLLQPHWGSLSPVLGSKWVLFILPSLFLPFSVSGGMCISVWL